jgi:hypothetical protein
MLASVRSSIACGATDDYEQIFAMHGYGNQETSLYIQDVSTVSIQFRRLPRASDYVLQLAVTVVLY